MTIREITAHGYFIVGDCVVWKSNARDRNAQKTTDSSVMVLEEMQYDM